MSRDRGGESSGRLPNTSGPFTRVQILFSRGAQTQGLRARPPADEVLQARRPLYLVTALLIVVALVLRQPLLVVAGLLVGTLLAVPELWYRFGLLGVVVQHGPAVRQAVFGDEVEVPLTVENRQILPLPWVEIDDEFPERLPVTGVRARTRGLPDRVMIQSVLGLWAYQRVRRRLRVRCEARGVFAFGPATVRISDPFGLLTREGQLPQQSLLLVFPLVLPIERFGLPARAPFGERKSALRLLEDPLRVAGVRPYMPGDEPRRVHWKATARLGALQSKIYEPATRHTLAVFVDVRTFDRGVYGYDADLVELAIAAAASVASWALDQGFAVGVYGNGVLAAPELDETAATRSDAAGSQLTVEARIYRAQLAGTLRLRVPPASNPAQLTRALEGLARLLPFSGLPMEQIMAREQGRLPLGATVIYIGAEAAVDVPLIVALRRLQAAGHSVTLLLTGVEHEGATSPGGAGAGPVMNLAGLTVRRLGGREMWGALVAEVLGRRAVGEADGRPDLEHAGAHDGRPRALVVE
jgi:uncharacterized protein (DUF58 family)